MESIKDKVAIVGMGCVRFGERWDMSFEDLVVEAAYEAFEDAGINPGDIQAAWIGTEYYAIMGLSLSQPLKLQYITVTRVENLCASGTEAVRAAAYAIASGTCDIALALGAEKLKDSGFAGLPDPGGTGGIIPGPVADYLTPPGIFSFVANRYFHHYGINPEEGKKFLAQVSVKNHHNGSLNPKAHFQREITLEQAINAPMVCYPLGLFDCCGVSDGAAAAILVRADMAKKFRDDPIYIKSLTICTGNREGVMSPKYDYVHFEENVRGAKMAYAEAGITNPFKEISVAEVHDCFTINEALICEDLGWCPRGEVKDYIESGTFTLKGELPINTDGGLKCFGHPIGASGIRMMYEVYKQLQGKAGPRQVKDAQIGLTHNVGGGPGGAVAAISILGN